MDRLSTTPRDAGRGYGPAGFRQIIWRALPNLDDDLETSGQKTIGVARAPSRPAVVRRRRAGHPLQAVAPPVVRRSSAPAASATRSRRTAAAPRQPGTLPPSCR